MVAEKNPPENIRLIVIAGHGSDGAVSIVDRMRRLTKSKMVYSKTAAEKK
jgi:hypothetical protein